MSSNDPIIGKQLGDYLVREVLGQGGMARVYKGYDSSLDRYAAVKVIEPQLISSEDDEEYRERFLREARAIARLNHPRIVGVFQFGQLDNLYYMAMVFVEGRDLRHILKEYIRQQKRLSNAQILRIMHDIADALDYSHTQGVIHRDVKPSNIMVMTDGHAVLTDFGLALNAQEGTIGNTFGSVHYIAPEQAVSSAQAVPQSDLYSLGVVLFEVLTGRVPFEDVSAMSVALKHISDPPPSPRSINPDIPEEVEAVLMQALDKDPDQRYSSGRAFVQALERAIAFSDDEDTHEMTSMPEPGDSAPAPARDTEPSVDHGTQPEPLTEEPIIMPDVSAESMDDLPTIGDSSKSRTAPTLSSSLPFMPVESAPAKKEESGSSRLMLIGAVVAVLLIAAAGLLLLGGGDDGDNDDGEATIVAASDDSQDGVGIVEVTSDPEPTEDETAEAQPTPLPPTETTEPTVSATDTATVEDPTATIQAETATPAPTRTPEPTSTLDLQPSATPLVDAQSEDEATVLLEYTWREIIIYNRGAGSDTVDVRNLSFESTSSGDTFSQVDWEFGNVSRWRMRPQIDCFQIMDAVFVELLPPDYCVQLQAFERVRSPFWSSEVEGETFDVLWNGDVVGTCPTVLRDESENPRGVRCVVDLASAGE